MLLLPLELIANMQFRCTQADVSCFDDARWSHTLNAVLMTKFK